MKDRNAEDGPPPESLWARAGRLLKGRLPHKPRDLPALAPGEPGTAAPERAGLPEREGSGAGDGEPRGPLATPDEGEQTDRPVIAAQAPAPLALPAPTGPLLLPATGRLHGQASLAIYVLGAFRVYQNDAQLERWYGIKCRSILKYLVAHRGTPVHREVLIEQFWPDANPEAARRNLHQAIYNLRRALHDGCGECSHILFEDGFYHLDSGLDLWIDSEEFQEHYKAGQRLEREDCTPEAVAEYELAVSLYGGDFLAEDMYEDWPLVQRESLKLAYLDILDRLSRYYFQQGQWAVCIGLCHKILAEDNCREDAHRRLMRCYNRQGHRHLALRQYHVCVDALWRELDVEPMPATVDLYQQIQANGNQSTAGRKLRKT